MLKTQCPGHSLSVLHHQNLQKKMLRSSYVEEITTEDEKPTVDVPESIDEEICELGH